MTKSILFVCTGNTCRSFLAEQLLRHHAAKNKLDMEVASAGLGAFAGDTATDQAVEVLREIGINGAEHRSRKVYPSLLEEYDLILPMTLAHKEQLLDLVPQLAGNISLLKEFAERANPGEDPGQLVEKDYGISDPYGQSVDVYRLTRVEIDRAVQAIVEYFLEGEGK
jgi:protein-tyrosine-phosphatase